MFTYKNLYISHNKIGDNMYFKLIFKTLILYFFIIFGYRLMGKKEVGELSIIDLIVSILIAELAAISIEQQNSSIFISIVPMLVLIVTQIVLSYISMKSESVRNFIDGKPSVLINKGKINYTSMKKMRYTLDDLTSQLREKGVKSLNEVDYAVLENSGTLSVFENSKDYPMPLILDGIIDYETLKEIKKTEKWLDNILKKENLNLEQIFYAFYQNREVFIIKKDELI